MVNNISYNRIRKACVENNMVRNLTIALLMLSLSVLGQETQDTTKLNQSLQFDLGIMATQPRQLPFWMKHNNSRRFTDNQAGAMYALMNYQGSFKIASWLKPGWEIETMSSAGNHGVYGKLIQANISVETPIARITAGLDEEIFSLNDSLLSIGGLSYGNNASPMPKVRVQTKGWLRSPIFPKMLSFKAYLAHGWFEANRVQSRAFLHQKYLYGRLEFFERRLSLMAGLNHLSQWGGRNIYSGAVQPTGINNYARIFLGMSGGDDALQTDQQNALGNHLGSYDLRTSFKFRDFSLANYWQFLWEDSSGLTPYNWRDGMVGFSFELNKTAIIDRFVFEVVRTNDQGAKKVGSDGVPFLEPDDFFNNGVYVSGWTYNNNMMGSPMFLLFDTENSFVNRIQTKVNAFNIGIAGHFKAFEYTLKYIDFKNNGTIAAPFEESLFVRSIDLSMNYLFNPQSSLGVRAIYQSSNFESDGSLGVQLQYRWRLNF